MPVLNYQSDLDHTLSLLARKDARFSVGRETEIEGKKVVGIDAECEGKKTTFYIDTQTHRVVEMVFKDMYFGDEATKELMEKRVRYGDYRTVDGIPFPESIVWYEDGRKKMEFKYEDIIFHPDVPPETFERPDRPLDLSYREERLH